MGLGLEPFVGIEVYKRKRARVEMTSKNLSKQVTVLLPHYFSHVPAPLASRAF
jgi:ABC-type uncharacterized transport system ATPase subunit